jgi:hypothetical protein
MTLRELKVIIDKFYEEGRGSYEVVYGSRLKAVTDVDHILIRETVWGNIPVKEEDIDWYDDSKNVIAIG